MRLTIAATILLLSVSNAHAETTTASTSYGSVSDFLHKTNSQLRVELKGDLNSDGLEDWAGVVFRETDEENNIHIKLVILTRSPDGRYVASVSTKEAEDQKNGSDWWDVEIKKSSIYINLHGKTCCEYSSTMYQFSFYKNIWRLVGIESNRSNLEELSSEKISINMITGDGIYISEDGKGKRKMRHKKLSNEIFLLKDFDFTSSYGLQPQ